MGVLFRSLAGWFISFVRKSPIQKKKTWIWGYPHGLETSKFDVYETPDMEKLPFGLRYPHHPLCLMRLTTILVNSTNVG